MESSPSRTVTFLFTDIEGSTHLLQQFGDDLYAQVQSDHRRLIRQAVSAQGGREQETQGDGFLFAFQQARAAVQAAVGAQQALHGYAWPNGVAVRVRMGLHTGIPVVRAEGYVGLDVHRAARICQAGWGGQILLSEGTQTQLRDAPADGVNLRDLGSHRLKDLQRPEKIFQVLHPELLTDFPPLRSLDRFPNNLPIQLTSFIGREQEIVEVRRLLSEARLLTLVGPGGIGKTRLGLQVAAELADEYGDGIWLVEMAPLTDPDQVARTVAGALHVREQPGRQLLDTLVDYLHPRRLLLVIDNSEHLVTACAALADTLLRRCPNLRILATSREPLGILGETIWRVPPLAVPDPNARPSPTALRRSEASRLFLERAEAVAPGFVVTERDAPAVAEICRQLDGIPLAIELAAARVKILRPEQIAARLDDRFRLLTGGSRAALPRQQTLQATLDWSYHLLSERERVLLRRLSVFAGGFTLEAAEHVCGLEPISPGDVLDLLERLAEKSLVAVLGQNGANRYAMLETIRVYGRDRLEEAGEASTMKDRHLRWFADLAERAWDERYGPEQGASLNRLEAEYGNIRAALNWSTTPQGPAEDGLRLAGFVSGLWFRGHMSEGRAWLQDLLGRVEDLPTPARARALNAASSLAATQGELDAGQVLATQALAVSKAVGDKENHVAALFELSRAAILHGDLDLSEALLNEGLALARGSDKITNLGEQDLLQSLGFVAMARGDYQRAARRFDEALALARRQGDVSGICRYTLNIGWLLVRQQQYAQAVPYVEEALPLAKELEEQYVMSFILGAFASIIGRCGQPAIAAQLFGTADATLKELGWSPPSSLVEDYQCERDFVRGLLGEQTFSAAHAEGQAIRLEHALEAALKQIEALHLTQEVT